MKEFKIDKSIEFDDNKLSALTNELIDCFYNNQDNFAKICYVVYKICDYCKNNFFKVKGNDFINIEYYNSTKLLAKFGFDKTEVSRLKKCYERFVFVSIASSEVTIISLFNRFSPSKLYELLPLSEGTAHDEVNAKHITPDMTVKEIRQYVKKLTTGEKQTETVEEKVEIKEDEIPMAYDPTKEYEYSYFETKSKNQLLNMIWDLQKAYQKLKGEKKK